MTEKDQSRTVRIGNAERDAAVAALDEHLAAGRLDLDEYGERYARALAARTESDLAELFTDLPPIRAQKAERRAEDVHPRFAYSRAESAHPGHTIRRLMAIVPLLALGLFFVTGTWWVFFLIPLAGKLMWAFSPAYAGRRYRC